MLTPQEAYDALRNVYPEVICPSVDVSFPDSKYYHMCDYRIDCTQLEYWIDKETGDVIKVDDMLKILERWNELLDTMPNPDDYIEHYFERQRIVKLIQPDGSIGDGS